MDEIFQYITFFAFFYIMTRVITWAANQTVGLPTSGAADLFTTVFVLVIAGIFAYNLIQLIWRRR